VDRLRQQRQGGREGGALAHRRQRLHVGAQRRLCEPRLPCQQPDGRLEVRDARAEAAELGEDRASLLDQPPGGREVALHGVQQREGVQRRRRRDRARSHG
jgi:hypothetical protein